jgi:hypothetical protein
VKFVGVSSDATEDNLAAEAQDDACLPGQRVPILDYPHISEQAATGVVYNSNRRPPDRTTAPPSRPASTAPTPAVRADRPC